MNKVSVPVDKVFIPPHGSAEQELVLNTGYSARCYILLAVLALGLTFRYELHIFNKIILWESTRGNFNSLIHLEPSQHVKLRLKMRMGAFKNIVVPYLPSG